MIIVSHAISIIFVIAHVHIVLLFIVLTLFEAFGSAPFDNNSSAAAWCPLLAALCNGVLPN